MSRLTSLALAVSLLIASIAAAAEKPFIPRKQDRPPGPPLAPAEAIAKMTVPDGFRVELVASEPDVVNPVAMTFDERGRVWLTESFEYPRSSPGEGRDRVKVLEDTDGDGVADKVTVFAEGLNIPSGIAVGHGGVWVANAPDILFMRDTDGDGKADKREVVVTGFGRTDTHELPNSLTWGPDGWLYGLNGVFNRSHVKHRGREWKFTCALFRIHPKTRDFEVFAEGTSNPWGIAWDTEGSAFISACVIDHLWHLVESGYYHRQGGPYPPHTWKIESIVEHKHQKAAYCGIHYHDSDVYPQKYRDRLYMGNIHGGCINSDRLERRGSTYFGRAEPDFLTANDVWFMPVVQKTGPDGSLYVLDWYDRYHCYQDARRDPKGIDRGHGRLYRVRYGDTPRVHGFDLAKESDERLVERLSSPNVYFRTTAQRILQERALAGAGAAASEQHEQLERLVLDMDLPRKARMHALFALVGGGPLREPFHVALLDHAEPTYRAWAVRAAGNQKQVAPAIRARVVALAGDSAPDVRLQVAIAARKLEGVDPVPLLYEVLAHPDDDRLIPHVVWQNLHPLLETDAAPFLALAEKADLGAAPGLARMMPHLVERVATLKNLPPQAVAGLFARLAEGGDAARPHARRLLGVLAAKVQTGELRGDQRSLLRAKLDRPLTLILAGPPDGPLYLDAALLAATWGDAGAVAATEKVLRDPGRPPAARLAALSALVAAEAPNALDAATEVLADRSPKTLALRGDVLAALGRLDRPQVATAVLAEFAAMDPTLRPRAIELLTSRPAWAKSLLDAIGKKQVEASAPNVNQVRKLLATGDAELARAVETHWGTLRAGRDPNREELIAQMRDLALRRSGDPHRGIAVYKKLCGQCHKMYGEGDEVGPDITRNGRASLEQLISNVFDPSLVIGAAYQARTIRTADGRVLTGLLVEDSPARVVLKVQGGKLETVAREDVEAMKVSELSMMPEGIEKQLKPQELADLLSYITLDGPPDDPKSRPLPGVVPGKKNKK